MGTLPLLNEGNLDLIVRYSLENEGGMAEAVVDAFLAADVDVYDQPTQLVDWINTDVCERLEWTADRPLWLCARIWDHGVVLTPEEVRIYRSSDLLR